MAGDWIKIRVELPRDPAVIGMASALELDEFGIVGRLTAAWAWADQHTPNGHAPGVTPAWLDRYVQAAGFAEAMAAAGWLEIGPDGLTFPNFEDHNGHNAKKRAQAQKRQQKKRTADADLSRTERDAGSDAQRDKSATREEKRREDLDPPCSPPTGGTAGGVKPGGRKPSKRKRAVQRGLPIEETAGQDTGQF